MTLKNLGKKSVFPYLSNISTFRGQCRDIFHPWSIWEVIRYPSHSYLFSRKRKNRIWESWFSTIWYFFLIWPCSPTIVHCRAKTALNSRMTASIRKSWKDWRNRYKETMKRQDHHWANHEWFITAFQTDPCEHTRN